MKEIFDFDVLRAYVTGKNTGKPIKMRIDSMNGGNLIELNLIKQ